MTPSCRLSSGPAPSAAPTSLAQASVAFEESSKRMAMADEAKGKSRELSGGGGPDQLRCQVGAHTGSASGGCSQTGWASPGPSAPQAADKQCTESLSRTTYPTQRGGRGSEAINCAPSGRSSVRCEPQRLLRCRPALLSARGARRAAARLLRPPCPDGALLQGRGN